MTLPDNPRGGLDILDVLAEERPFVAYAIITGWQSREIQNYASARGAAPFVKPVTPEDLLGLLLDARASIRGRPPLGAVVAGRARDWGLTPAQANALMALSQGRTRAEAAREIGTKTTTLSTHIREILRRSGDCRLEQVLARLLCDATRG